MTERRAYPSDLSDARRELVQPVLSTWHCERSGRVLTFGHPPWQTVCGYFTQWQRGGIFVQPGGLLRELPRIQEEKGHRPSASVIYKESMKTSTSVPAGGLDHDHHR